VDFVENCNVYIGKMIIKAAKRIFNSDKICRSYSDLNFGVTYLEHSVEQVTISDALSVGAALPASAIGYNHEAGSGDSSCTCIQNLIKSDSHSLSCRDVNIFNMRIPWFNITFGGMLIVGGQYY